MMIVNCQIRLMLDTQSLLPLKQGDMHYSHDEVGLEKR